MKVSKNKLPLILAFICVVLCLCAPAGFALADAGGFSGATDFGGLSGSGSGSSGDDELLGDILWLVIWLCMDVPYGWVIVLVVAIILGIVFLVGKIKGFSTKPSETARKANRNRMIVEDTFNTSKLNRMGSYANFDPNFSEEAMREQVSNLYVRMQNAWTDKDFEPMRPYFSDGLYAQFDRQLDSLRRRGQTNYVDNIAVLSVTFEGWYQENNQDMIALQVKTRIIDYTMDDQTKRVTAGSTSDEKFMTYRWIMARTTGATTSKEKGVNTVTCPNCAAVLNINKTAQCPYCDSIITVSQHDWVISAIQGLSQTTR